MNLWRGKVWIRSGGRLFSILFVLFNVLLAAFNVLNYRYASRSPLPCVVIVEPNQPALDIMIPNQRVVGTSIDPAAIAASTKTATLLGEGNNTSTNPHTRRVNMNSTETVELSTYQFNESNFWEAEQRGKYTVIKRYILSEGPAPGFNASVTLCTQGTFEFLQHVQELCQRWEGPLSVSVYAPGTDLPVAVRKILFLRTCGPPCVRLNVTWHLIFETTQRILESPHAVGEMEYYEPLKCENGTKSLNLVSDFRSSKKLPYPINVARNVARQLATTRYILSSDIELYPSLHIVPRFLNLVSRLSREESKPTTPRVYTLPIFEVQEKFFVPKTKEELVQRIREGHAIFFAGTALGHAAGTRTCPGCRG